MSKTIQVGTGRFRGKTNTVLQRAVDTVFEAGGGTVEIPAGTYEMSDALHLRSRVHVVGELHTILRKVPSISVPLADYLGYGHYEFTVTHPEKLRVGMGVHLTDQRAGGFYDTVATIVGRAGDLFFINRMLNHDYGPGQGGCVNTLFSLVEGRHVRDVRVRGLTLDGNRRETRRLNGCRGGGLFLLMCDRVRVEEIEVRHFFGDAISFQQCTDISISGCLLHDNTGGGVHPGSGSVRYVISRNQIRRNGGCGVFYCLRTMYSRCEDNEIENNGAAGISIGERDTHHAIRGNTIRLNAAHGICFRTPLHQSGDDVLIEGNTLGRNCRKQGRHEIHIPERLHRIAIARNAITPGRGKALFVGPKTADIVFAENTVNGRPQAEKDVQGELHAKRNGSAEKPRAVGPDGAPRASARHLKIDRLPPAPRLPE